MWDQPLNQRNVKRKLEYQLVELRTQPFNHMYGSQLQSLSCWLSPFTIDAQPLNHIISQHLFLSLPHPVRYNSREINHSTTKCHVKIEIAFDWAQPQPLNHIWLSQLGAAWAWHFFEKKARRPGRAHRPWTILQVGWSAVFLISYIWFKNCIKWSLRPFRTLWSPWRLY